MTDDTKVQPDTAKVLAGWAGLAPAIAPDQMAEILEGVRQVVDRLYAVDVESFEADYIRPENSAR